MVQLFFALPGHGKSSFATMYAIRSIRSKRLRKKYPNGCYVNFGVSYPGVKQISNDMIGKYAFEDCLLIIDEASLFADNRDYKSFSKELLSFFMLHRHYRCDIMLFSQGYNAVDKKIRSVCDSVYMIQKGIWTRSWLSSAYRIPYGIAFSSSNMQDSKGKSSYGDIVEGYKAPSFIQRIFAKRCIRPLYYKYFDSWDAPKLLPLPSHLS